MLVVTLENWPQGCDEGKYQMGEIIFRPDGGDDQIAHYFCTIQRSPEFAAEHQGPFRSGYVLNFHRHLLGPYDLLLRGLIATVGGRSHIAVAQMLPEIPVFSPAPSSIREVA